MMRNYRVGVKFSMTSLTKAFVTLTFSFSSIYAISQVNDQKIRQQVLEKSITDSLFVFGKWTKKGGEESHLKYLGQVTTRQGHTFKILTSSWFWGLSHRATSRILVFNGENQYVGNYNVTMTTDLPTKMENGELIFKNINEDCDKKIETLVDLKNGLPRQFFKKCKNNLGDFYRFDNE